MTHFAIQEQLDGKAVDWMEKVTDEQYQGELTVVRGFGSAPVAKQIDSRARAAQNSRLASTQDSSRFLVRVQTSANRERLYSWLTHF